MHKLNFHGVIEKKNRSLSGHHNAKTCLCAYMDSEGQDQPAHPHSLIRAFSPLKQKHWYSEPSLQQQNLFPKMLPL